MKVSVASLLKQPIGAHAEYRVMESPIAPRGDNSGLLDTGATAIDAEIQATHTDPGALLEGEARASVAQTCSRCLRPIESAVTARFAEQYYATLHVESGARLAEAPSDAKTIGSDFRIDLTPLLREELLLAMPQAPLCRPDCAGLCPVCGEDLNERPHTHDEAADDRWAKLRQIREELER